MGMEKKYKQSEILKLNAIWASCIVGIVALIGAFWGYDGYRIVGIIVGAIVLLSILFTIGIDIPGG